ncbi:putative 20S-pre-rRNA D-site endonuclease nob1 [Venustampulla echinocandica]|uniref:20S-pre-rRNA D-site endonuclease NOB1 n=1 Tax=Venustampulla echinocandica TaxID=2656787 RepID=A0A370TZN8_9HELO|nr:putative 20S-pre-rRNA D-site endonuclease nob1 [Venustampulla echinocandica]RDL40958.1 putative 20S-pre-rRNA D-site endonuclease nob1 [Venustampulla echinocandica]
MAMNTNTQKPIHSIVLDAGPIIKNEPSVSTLLGQAEELYTIPAVIDEIRDPVTRARVETTLKPFIKCRSPTPASIKVITDFARRTGDLEVLSRPDIHLMALAYELECERNHGDWRLRSVPGQKRLNGNPPAPAEELAPEKQETQTEGIEKQLAESHISSDAGQQVVGEASAEEQLPKDVSHADEGNSLPDPVEEIQASESDDTDDEGWITPKNLKKYQEKDLNGLVEREEEVKTIQVAVITSDFAMQNVLLRMNLNLCSSTLQRIRQLKTWVLRCHACFYITKDMSKQFCTRCGGPTLLRTSCSTDKNGNFKVHLKKNMQWNTRGNVYSVPKPVAGTSNGKMVAGGGKGGWGQGLILAEDQKEYVAAMTSARRKKDKDLMDEDYLPNILSGDRGRAGGRPKVGAGRNVNSKKRR